MTDLPRRRGNLPHYPVGFFMPADLIHGSVPPWGALMCPRPSWCQSTGKAEPSFYFRPHSKYQDSVQKSV